jgi:hypothetical protein
VRWSLLAGVAAAVATSSCGYSTRRLVSAPGVSSVAVAQFENDTFRRDLEFRLTRAVAEEVRARTSWRIESPGRADAILTGTIRSAETTVLSEDPNGKPELQRYRVLLEVTLTERASGRVIRHWHVGDAQEWSEGRFGESLDGYATDEVVRRLAERVVAGLEKPIGCVDRPPPPKGGPRKHDSTGERAMPVPPDAGTPCPVPIPAPAPAGR